MNRIKKQITVLAYLIKDYLLFNGKSINNDAHLKDAVAWLYRAHDATPDRGVSHSYLIGRGWMPSYPETTGYIIPTLINWHKITSDDEARERALEMADWECTVQLENGAIPGLSTGEPVVFDTGQVIFGWLSAYKATGDNKYLQAATRAGNWLIENLESDFTWRSYGNPGSNSIHTYNVRAAWALLELWIATGIGIYKTAAEGFMEWALKQEAARGWFKHNCLNDNEKPLLHTIAYTAQGLIESGIILKNDKCIEAAIRTYDELVKQISADGRMPGRFDSNWMPAAKWCCLTGMAQSSIVWRKLYAITGSERYKSSSEKVNNFLKKTQDMSSGNPGIRGGIKGSYPANGEYGKYRILNWATKFFIDALLMEEHPDFKGHLY